MQLADLLKYALKKEASDIHIKTGSVPLMRKHGKLLPLSSKIPPLKAKHIDGLILPVLNERQAKDYENKKVIDMALKIEDVGRFRLSIFSQMGQPRVVVRALSLKIPALEDLSLPPVVERIANLERGLVLITGVTGSGKSTTLASILNHININKNKHILTIEDPVEYLFEDQQSMVTQRELGIDAENFSSALKAALRQDPDVILIGEMRDPETIETALNAASTGHLVLSTLHTIDAQESINRILSMVEPTKRERMRMQLAGSLKAVVSQRLVPRSDQPGHIPAVEILINNKRIQGMIEQPERTPQITKVIQESQGTYGMQSFDQSLSELVINEQISMSDALRMSSSPEDLKIRMSGMTKASDRGQKAQSNLTSWTQIQNLKIDDIDDE